MIPTASGRGLNSELRNKTTLVAFFVSLSEKSGQKPTVTVDNFADYSLLLTQSCFIGTADDRVPAKSALHQLIDQKFREMENSMAFPKRDIHQDTMDRLISESCRKGLQITKLRQQLGERRIASKKPS